MTETFNNNYPATPSAFPTMLDHVDAIRHAYFTGLHAEIQAIETILGLGVKGSEASLRARLDAIVPSTAKDSAVISTPEFWVLPDTAPAVVDKVTSGDTAYWRAKLSHNAQQGCMFISPAPDWSGYIDIKLSVYWKTAGVDEHAKLKVAVSFRIDDEDWNLGTGPTTWFEADAYAQSVANKLIITSITKSVSYWETGQMLQFKIYRYGNDANDHLEEDMEILAVKLERG